MKTTICQIELAQALQKLCSLTPNRSAVPIWQNVLLDAVDNGLYCTTTNGEISTKILVDGKTEKHGRITVNCKKLYFLIKELDTKEVDLITTGANRLQILSGKGKYTFGGLDADEFPEMPLVDQDEPAFIIPAGNLKAALIDTDFAASHEEVRYLLHGVSLKFYKDKIEFAGCDGKMFAVATYRTKIDKEIEQMVIPLRSCQEIKKIFSEDEDIFVFVEGENLVLFTNAYQFFSRKIELAKEGYPDYWKVINFMNEKVVLANKDQLFKAVRRVGQFTRDSGSGVTISVDEDENALKVTDQDESYDSQEFVNISSKTENLKFRVNALFLLSVLKHLDCDDVMISMAPNNNRITLKCPDKDNQIYTIALLVG